jgi:hypothetical protein
MRDVAIVYEGKRLWNAPLLHLASPPDEPGTAHEIDVIRIRDRATAPLRDAPPWMVQHSIPIANVRVEDLSDMTDIDTRLEHTEAFSDIAHADRIFIYDLEGSPAMQASSALYAAVRRVNQIASVAVIAENYPNLRPTLMREREFVKEAASILVELRFKSRFQWGSFMPSLLAAAGLRADRLKAIHLTAEFALPLLRFLDKKPTPYIDPSEVMIPIREELGVGRFMYPLPSGVFRQLGEIVSEAIGPQSLDGLFDKWERKATGSYPDIDRVAGGLISAVTARAAS